MTLNELKSKLDKTLTPITASQILGEPNRVWGSGYIIYDYILDDGSKVSLGWGYDINGCRSTLLPLT